MNQARGRAAEDAALCFLQSNGLTLLARNHRCRLGEIDLVMRDAVARNPTLPRALQKYARGQFYEYLAGRAVDMGFDSVVENLGTELSHLETAHGGARTVEDDDVVLGHVRCSHSCKKTGVLYLRSSGSSPSGRVQRTRTFPKK